LRAIPRVEMDVELNEEQTEYREVFKLFVDDKGTITTKLAGVLRYLGTNPTNAELALVEQEIGDNPVDFPKFLHLITQQKKKEASVREELLQAFKIFDKNNTGGVSRQELRLVLISIGEPLTEDEIDEMIKEAEIKDGNILYEDFIKMLLSK